MKGFTLLEVITTLMVLAILSTVCMTSYSEFWRKNEQKVIVDELRTAIQYAKTQAMILGISVVLAPLDDSLDWSNGAALKFFNKKINKLELIHQWPWHHSRWNMKWMGINNDQIIFSNNPVNAISNGRFILKNKDTCQEYVIILNRLGRIRLDNTLSLMC